MYMILRTILKNLFFCFPFLFSFLVPPPPYFFNTKMHCSNLNVSSDFNSLLLPLCRPSTGVPTVGCNLRFNRIVAFSASHQSSGSRTGPGGGGSGFSRTETYTLLKQQMEVAAKAEDYKEAAKIRDSLKLFEEEEPVLCLQRLLKEAIAEERFQDAARYRDELKEISAHSFLRCTSDATTMGVRVQVRSAYFEGRSEPSKGLYFFAYRIRITNNSNYPVQLLRKQWIITDANGKTESVHGVGVIGEQPVILPSTSFEYSSACPLGTPSGRMEGDFEMNHVDKVGGRTFNAAIAPFSLSTFGDSANTD